MCAAWMFAAVLGSHRDHACSWLSADLSGQAGQPDAPSILVVPSEGGEGSWCEVQARGGHVQQVGCSGHCCFVCISVSQVIKKYQASLKL